MGVGTFDVRFKRRGEVSGIAVQWMEKSDARPCNGLVK